VTPVDFEVSGQGCRDIQLIQSFSLEKKAPKKNDWSWPESIDVVGLFVQISGA
jgi:hypothetical protein